MLTVSQREELIAQCVHVYSTSPGLQPEQCPLPPGRVHVSRDCEMKGTLGEELVYLGRMFMAHTLRACYGRMTMLMERESRTPV